MNAHAADPVPWRWPRVRALPWRRHRLVLVGGGLVAVVVLAAAFAGVVSPYSPYAIDVAHRLEPPGWAHWLGTDQYGRDVLSRTIFGAQISVKVGIVAVSVGLAGGMTIGIVSGYFGGPVDMVLMRFMELLFSFPAILLAIVLMAILGTNILNAMVAIGIIFIPGFSRLARAGTHEVLREQYVEAAHAVGMPDFRILTREILPNVITLLIVEAMIAFGYAVLLAASLNFLGLGAQEPEAAWGHMLSTGSGFMEQAPWLAIVPGVALSVAVLGFNLLGDGLRDLLDPRLRR